MQLHYFRNPLAFWQENDQIAFVSAIFNDDNWKSSEKQISLGFV